jgi:hypothetical protein
LGPSTNKNLSGWTLAAIVLTALILISPTFFFGQISGNDFNFHIASWMEVVHQWHQGVIYPSWAAGAYDGFGEPRFIFYPPTSWLLGAGLGAVLPWNIVPDVFLFLILVLAGASMHCLARRWMSPQAALAAAIIYMTNPYQLVDVYVRSPTAELLAGAILPLAVLCVFNCAGNEHMDADQPDRERWRNIALLSIVYAAIWFTNAPMSVVTSYALAFLLIVLAAHRRSFAPLLNGGAGMALGLLLACAYIVPATYEQRWVNIEQAISRGLIFTDSIIFRWVLDPRHSAFNLMISTVATFEIVVAFAAAMVLRRRTGKTGTVWIALIALAVLSTVIMLPVTGSILQYLPKMRFVQFPWRWLIVLGISFSFFLGSAITISRRKMVIAVVYLLILAAERTVLTTRFAWWDSEDVGQTIAAIQTGTGYEGTEEYGPRLGDPSNLPDVVPLISLLPEGTRQVPRAPQQSISQQSLSQSMPANISMQSWLDQHKVFTVASPLPVVAAVHLLNYPAWRIRVNGRPAANDFDPDTGQMLLRLPGGTSHIDIRFGWTRDRTAGCALSGLGILILSCIVIIGWRRSPLQTQ